MKPARSRDVARAAGVSQTTVSLVLNNRRDIALSETTRERVRATATRLGYRPNQLARNLLRGHTGTLGVILPSLASSFVAQIAEGIQAAAWDHDRRVLLAHTRHQTEVEARQLDLLLQQQVDGVLLVTGEGTLADLPQRLDTLAQAGVPCIVIDETSVAARVDCVATDDRLGARVAVQHLLQLGHRHIGHLGAGTTTSSSRERLAGYRDALTAAGLRFNPRRVAGTAYVSGSASTALDQLLHESPRPTAVFAANDRHLAEALPRLAARGLRVPDDLALVGYANYDFSAYLGFTSVDQQPRELGRRALLQLLRRLQNPNLKPTRIVLSTRLVVRHSCGTANRSPVAPSTATPAPS